MVAMVNTLLYMQGIHVHVHVQYQSVQVKDFRLNNFSIDTTIYLFHHMVRWCVVLISALANDCAEYLHLYT